MYSNKSVDELLIKLEETSQPLPLNENSIDIGKKFSSLSKKLINDFSNLSTSHLTNADKQLLKEIDKVDLNRAYYIVTYPNIHNTKKYSIDARVFINYIIDKIEDSAKNDTPFNSFNINAEAISYTLKKLIGKTPRKAISLDEFKYQYKLYAFGSYRKVQMIPRIYDLKNLVMKTPIIIEYIDNKLIYRHIYSIREYASQLQADFGRLIKNDPSLEKRLNAYTYCLELGIKNMMRIYEIIRSTFVELSIEYRRVLRQIIDIHNAELKSSNNESIILMNNLLAKLNTLQENTNSLNESIDITQVNNSNESLEDFIVLFKNIQKEKILERTKIKQNILNNVGLLSIIDEPPEDFNVEIYEGVNRLISNELPIDNLDFNGSLTNIIRDKENYDDYTLNKFVVTFINSIGINSISNCGSVNDAVNNIKNQLLGNRILIKPNLKIISENLFIIPKIIDKLNTDYSDILQSILIDYLNNTNNFKNNTSFDYISTIKKFILSTMAINDCIFDSIKIIVDQSFDIINKIKEM